MAISILNSGAQAAVNATRKAGMKGVTRNNIAAGLSEAFVNDTVSIDRYGRFDANGKKAINELLDHFGLNKKATWTDVFKARLKEQIVNLKSQIKSEINRQNSKSMKNEITKSMDGMVESLTQRLEELEGHYAQMSK